MENLQIDPEQGLGVKVLSWLKEKYVSPSQKDFGWPREGEVTAKCRFGYNTGFHLGNSFEACHCGIYAAFHYTIALGYAPSLKPLSLVVLLQPYGETIYSEEGFRSEQAKVIGVVSLYNDFSPGTINGGEYFNVPIIGIKTAGFAIDLQMIKIANRHGFEYNPKYLTESVWHQYLETIGWRSSNAVQT